MSCNVDRCGRKIEGNGLCKSHNQRQRNGRPLYCDCGQPIPLIPGHRWPVCLDCKNNAQCKYEGCDKIVHQREYCRGHYMQWYRGRLGPYFCTKCEVVLDTVRANQKFCDACSVIQRRESGLLHTNRRRDKHYAGIKYTKREIYELDNGICYLCQELTEYIDYEIEHIVPLSRDGEDRPENVAVAHKICNRRKGVLNLEDTQGLFPDMILTERFETWRQSYSSLAPNS